jgi:hypothetical protein
VFFFAAAQPVLNSLTPNYLFVKAHRSRREKTNIGEAVTAAPKRQDYPRIPASQRIPSPFDDSGSAPSRTRMRRELDEDAKQPIFIAAE